MKDNLGLIIGLVIVGIAFAVAWKNGWLLRAGEFVDETKEELKKCTWPTRQELWGSLGVVIVSIILLGLFTVGVDAIFTVFVRYITTI